MATYILKRGSLTVKTDSGIKKYSGGDTEYTEAEFKAAPKSVQDKMVKKEEPVKTTEVKQEKK